MGYWLLNRLAALAEDTFVRQRKEKHVFLLLFAHLIVPLRLRLEDRRHLGNKNK